MRLFGRPVAQYALPGALLAVSIGYVVMAAGYSREGRLVPLLVGAAMIVLLPIDLIAISETRLGRRLRRLDAAAAPVEPEFRVSRRRQLASLGWMIAFALLIVAVGVAAAIPIYVAGSMRLLGRRSWASALATAAAAGIFSYLLFTYALAIDLYPGLLAGLIARP